MEWCTNWSRTSLIGYGMMHKLVSYITNWLWTAAQIGLQPCIIFMHTFSLSLALFLAKLFHTSLEKRRKKVCDLDGIKMVVCWHPRRGIYSMKFVWKEAWSTGEIPYSSIMVEWYWVTLESQNAVWNLIKLKFYEDIVDGHKLKEGHNSQAVRWPGVPKVAHSRLTECSKSCDLQPALHCAIRGAQGGLPCVGWGVRSCQLDLPSLTPLSVAGCGRPQLGAPYLATSVNYCK